MIRFKLKLFCAWLIKIKENKLKGRKKETVINFLNYTRKALEITHSLEREKWDLKIGSQYFGLVIYMHTHADTHAWCNHG